MRIARLTIALVTLPLVLAACSSGGSEAAPSGSSSAAASGEATSAIVDRTFESTKATEAGAEHALVAGAPISITFTAEDLSARPGCNTLAGAYTVVDGALVADQLASTMMACEQDLMDQDTWFADLLAAKPSITVAGDTMTLTTKESSVEFAAVETVGAYDTPVFGEDELPKVEALCAQLVADGATEQAAQAAAEDKGYQFRVLIRDGEAFPATMDHNPGRVNVEVTDGTVTVCTAG